MTRVLRWVGLAVALAIGSMIRYPGGTLLDRSTVNYSLSQNFLSDLGMTVAYDGRSNRLGAVLFTMSLGALVIGLGGWLIMMLRSYWQEPRPRRFARAAAVVGFVVVAAFAGVAVTPENLVMARHVDATLLAWRALPVLTLILMLASLQARFAPRRETIGWGVLTALLVGYIAVLGWGPALDTPHGLRVQVVAQKLITVGTVAILIWLSAVGSHETRHTRK